MSFEFTGFVHDGVAWGFVDNSTTKYRQLCFWSRASGSDSGERLEQLACVMAKRLCDMPVEDALLYFDEPGWATWGAGIPAPIARLVNEKSLADAQAKVAFAKLPGTGSL